MTHAFPLFVRRFPGAGYQAVVLGHPHLASFGETMADVYADLSTVLERLLLRGELRDAGPSLSWTQRRVELDVRALQRGRLLTVPMRFTVLLGAREVTKRAKGARQGLRLLVPRLGVAHTLHDERDVDAFAEEVIRHELHLAPLERLLEVAWAGEESVRTVTVNVHYDVRAEARKLSAVLAKPKRAPLPPGLSEACRRLDDERESGAVERAYQRDAEAQRLAEALTGSGRKSVLLVGPPLVGKTALVHELVHRAAEAKPGTALHGLEVYSTSGARVVAGMRYLGEWQDRVRRMVGSLRLRPAVLHFDSLAELLATGASRAESGLDLPQQLLPSLQAGEVRLVVEATPEDVARAERTHGAFLRALETQRVAPLPPVAARQALAQAARRVGRQRKVEVDESAQAQAVDLVERFGEAGGVPGAAIDLLRAAARPKADASGSAAKLLDGARVLDAFVARTGYPRALVDTKAKLDPGDVLARLQARVVGQREAMELLRNLVVTLKTGLTDPSRPLGAYLLVGPTGVGKTESALSLAAYLFGDEQRLTRFDMAEYAAPGSAALLVASGSAHGGSLTAKVRERPFGVVLLDEIEKADGSVHDLLLQLLGEGRLSDSSGRTVSFRNTVVLLTSNLGAESATKTFGFGAQAPELQRHYVSAATQFFRPELVNRLDQIVAYHPLSEEDLRLIAARALEQALGREGLVRRGVRVRWSDDVVRRVAALGFDPRYGARPLKRAVEQHVVARVVELVASEAARPGVVELTVGGDGAVSARWSA